jgi:predicted TIM-barrel fold metal-dependent hydrolase
MFAMMKQEPDKIAAGDGRYLVDELERILAMGYDGIKMMDGKPSNRRSWMPLPIDHEYFHPYWDRAEEIDVPITMHVCDPIDYWDPEREGSYQDLGPQEEFFRQAIAVLERNPALRITFAHFLFMGPQLDRLGELFSRFPGMRVDMAMGHEFLYYLSDDPDKARDFYIKWQHRILYGTDISDHNSLRLARAKAETLRLFLETNETFVNLTAAAMDRPPIVGSNGRVELHGLNLPQEVLDRVMWRNFEAFAGRTPKPLP